jgi:hypothetical protein
MHIKLIAFLLTVLLPITAYSQSLAETLKYLNTTLNKDAGYSQQSQGQKIVCTVSQDGKMTIKTLHRDGFEIQSYYVYLKGLCGSTSCYKVVVGNLDNESAGYERGETYLHFKAQPGSSYLKSMMYEKVHNDIDLVVSVDGYDTANRVKNAFFHLVKLAKANPKYLAKGPARRKGDSNDPFDY